MTRTTAASRRRFTRIAAAPLALVLIGCDAFPEAACPAIGWLNTVDVQLEGSVDQLERVASVELCDDRGCSTSESQPVPPSPIAVPGTVSPYYRAESNGRGRWSVDVGMAAPDNVTVRAFALDSTLLGEVEADLAWIRVGGSEQCGGPMSTDPLALPLTG